MRLSINLATLPTQDPVAALARLGNAADDLGVHTVWIPDHLQQMTPSRSPDEPVLEAYQALTFLAATTRRVRLGAMVSSVAFRPIPLLVKLVGGLDLLSDGRAWFGIGAGYPSAENDNLDVRLPPLRERFDRVEDAVRLARHTWSGSDDAFTGISTVMPHPVQRPLPIQRSGPPILIGGAGEKRTLPLVARHADACNLFDLPDLEELRRKLAVLDAHLATLNRPRNAVERTISVRWAEDDPAPFLDRLAALEETGFGHAVVLRDGDWTTDSLARLMHGAAAS